MVSIQQFRKFDPEEHPGDEYDAFGEYTDAFQYEYEATANPPTGTAEEQASWIQQNKRKQLLGRFASRNLQRDCEDTVPVVAERSTITFDKRKIQANLKSHIHSPRIPQDVTKAVRNL